MCGIAGIYHFDPQRPVDASLLRRMTQQIRHRGPDAEGFHQGPNIGLGFRRLAIIDLSAAGNQPMCNEDESLWIVFNGEFYGFREHQERLKKAGHVFKSRTDTETVLHLYEEHGVECLQYLDGMFAFALWDRKTNDLLLVRDRLGIKPLHYAVRDSGILFGSEIKSILQDPTITRDIDEQALHDYLSFMTVPAPRSIYKGISKLLPGHYLRVHNGSVAIRPYWNLPTEPVSEMSRQDALGQLEDVLSRAVRSQLLSDVPLGAFLSGGVDSSAVVALMSEGTQEPVKTFAISFPGLEEYDESSHARDVSAMFSTHHMEFAVTPQLIDVLPKLAWHFDEPFAVSSAFATYFLAKMTREHVTVALTGDGGDELFAGYPFRYSMDARFARVGWVPRSVRSLVFGLVQHLPVFGTEPQRRFLTKARTAASFFTNDADEAFFRTFTYFDEPSKKALRASGQRGFAPATPSLDVLSRHYREAGKLDPVNRRLYGDLKTTLVDEMLTKVDRMTMAFGLEARVPLLDHRLVEFVMRLPGAWKIRGRDGKLLLKAAMSRFLPSRILERRKHGFTVPMDRWLREDLHEYLCDHLSEETVRRRGYFEPRVVQKLIRDHKEQKANNVGQLYTLLSFELWHRAFLDHPVSREQGTLP